MNFGSTKTTPEKFGATGVVSPENKSATCDVTGDIAVSGRATGGVAVTGEKFVWGATRGMISGEV